MARNKTEKEKKKLPSREEDGITFSTRLLSQKNQISEREWQIQKLQTQNDEFQLA